MNRKRGQNDIWSHRNRLLYVGFSQQYNELIAIAVEAEVEVVGRETMRTTDDTKKSVPTNQIIIECLFVDKL